VITLQENHKKMIEALAKSAGMSEQVLTGGGVRELMKGKGTGQIMSQHRIPLECWKRTHR
jgi:hypothetical protein